MPAIYDFIGSSNHLRTPIVAYRPPVSFEPVQTNTVPAETATDRVSKKIKASCAGYLARPPGGQSRSPQSDVTASPKPFIMPFDPKSDIGIDDRMIPALLKTW
jgi:hypothetical protein